MKKILFTATLLCSIFFISCGSDASVSNEEIIETQDSLDGANQDDAFDQLLLKEETEKDTNS